MNLHFPLPKFRTIGDELTLSLAKNSHFSFLPSWRGHHCGAEIRNEFTLSIAKNFFAVFGDELTLSLAKNSHFSFHGDVTIVALKFAMTSHFPLPKFFFALFVPPLSNGTSRATSDRKPKTNDQILPSPVLFFPSKK